MLCTLVSLIALFVTNPVDKSSLDFWIGDWSVESKGVKQGDDRVEKWLSGNVIVEHWRDVEGNEGKSFFYYMPAQKQWKQVWVTSQGAYKEKLSEPWADGIRFVGTVYLPNGKTVSDRTTLERLSNGDSHQLIEAKPEGDKWITTFDAIYHKVSAAEEADHSKDMDFWVGEWDCSGDMVGQNGQTTATKAENSISKILDGKVLQERFTMRGLNGLSVSAFNKATGRWRQTWVDNQGAYIALSGSKVGKDIILTTVSTAAQPQNLSRMVFTNISATSFDWNWEASADGGKTWKLQWHLHYVRKSSVPKNESGEK